MARLTKEHRKRQIIDAAIRLGEERRLYTMSLRNIAEKAGCSVALVKHHYTSLTNIRNTCLDEAISAKNYVLLAQGVVSNDPQLDKAPPEMIKEALKRAAEGFIDGV